MINRCRLAVNKEIDKNAGLIMSHLLHTFKTKLTDARYKLSRTFVGSTDTCTPEVLHS